MTAPATPTPMPTPARTPALLQVSGLRKTYRTGGTEVVAVDGLSFDLRAGERSASSGSPAPGRPPRPGC